MSPFRPDLRAPFRDGVTTGDLELHGVRARAFSFRGGAADRRRALVCIAGMGADGRSFMRQRPLASEWLVLPLNLPWETPRHEDPVTFAAEVVEEYLASERLESPVLLGSSFGGAVAASVALRRRASLSALVLANAVVSRRQIPLATTWFIDLLEAPDPLARLVSPLAAQVMGGFGLDREGRHELVREARHFGGPELKRRLVALLHLDLFPELPRLAVPTLFVHGRRDLLVSWRSTRWAAERVPDARVEIIPKAGHVPYLSHPEPFNAAVAAFLRDVERRRAAGELHAPSNPSGGRASTAAGGDPR